MPVPDWRGSSEKAISAKSLRASLNKKTGRPNIVTNFARKPLKGTDERKVKGFFLDHKDVFGIKSPDREINLSRAGKDSLGNKVLRCQQVFRGLRVFGSQMIIRLDEDEAATHCIGNFAPNIPLDFSIEPRVAARQSLKGTLRRRPGVRQLGKEELLILPFRDGYRLAHRFVLEGQRPIRSYKKDGTPIVREVLAIWDSFIDATDGKTELLSLSRVKSMTSKNYKGEGKGCYSGSTESLWTRLDSDSRKYTLEDRRRGSPSKVITHDALQISGEEQAPVAADDDGTWSDEAQASLVDCHLYTSKTSEYFKSRHKRKGIDGKNGVLHIWGNCPPSTGCLWIGPTDPDVDQDADSTKPHVRIGNADDNQFNEFCALDLIAHEWTHGLIASEVLLPYIDWWGAIEEGLCDAFAVFVKVYAARKQDAKDDDFWLIGRDAWLWKDVSPAVRNMKNPSNERGEPCYIPDSPLLSANNGYQPDYLAIAGNPDNQSLRDLDYGGVHVNSGIVNRATYLMCEGGKHREVDCGKGIGVSVLERIYYDLITNCLTTTYVSENTHEGVPAELETLEELLIVSIDKVYGAQIPQLEQSEKSLGQQYVDGWKATVRSAFEAIRIEDGEHQLTTVPAIPEEPVNWILG